MEETGEKLEFLHREEIRTMAKDMGRLREEEAKKERERIVTLQVEKKTVPAPAPVPETQTQAKAEIQVIPQTPPQPKEPEKEKIVLIPPPYTPPSRMEKIFIRVAIAGFVLFLVANAVAAAYFFFWRKTPQPPPPQQEEQQPVPETPAPPEPLLPPASLIKEGNTITLEYADASQIPELLSQSLQRVLPQGFTRVLVQNQQALPQEEQAYASTKTILEAFSVVPPQELNNLLGNNTTPFVFFSNGKNHLGFVMEASNPEQGLALMKSWEPTLERDTETLFGIMGEKGIGYASFFRGTSYKQVPIRFQTLSNKDFGIVYAFSGNRLLLAESLESMKALIDNI